MIEVAKCFERKCKHYRGVKKKDGDESTEVHVCAAYPDGIPDDITGGIDLHEEVRQDQDNNIIYEKE